MTSGSSYDSISAATELRIFMYIYVLEISGERVASASVLVMMLPLLTLLISGIGLVRNLNG